MFIIYFIFQNKNLYLITVQCALFYFPLRTFLAFKGYFHIKGYCELIALESIHSNESNGTSFI